MLIFLTSTAIIGTVLFIGILALLIQGLMSSLTRTKGEDSNSF